MAPIKLYHFPASAPSRIALLTARAVEIPVDVEIVDLFKKEQLKAEFTKLNPQHCVPTLDDNGFVLWESRAIACYLADKYAKDDKLYPKDLQKRALVDQRLYFDSSSLYVRIRAIAFPVLFLGVTTISESLKNDLNTTIGFLETFLSTGKWLCGDHYTLADIACFASLSSILAVGWDISSYPNVQRWIKDCEVLPGWQENQDGANVFGAAVKANLKS